jgi:hypothetical protein
MTARVSAPGSARSKGFGPPAQTGVSEFEGWKASRLDKAERNPFRDAVAVASTAS